MINQEELAICKRRGHDQLSIDHDKWRRCSYCGIWQRTVTIVETREDDPPESEQSPFEKLRRGK